LKTALVEHRAGSLRTHVMLYIDGALTLCFVYVVFIIKTLDTNLKTALLSMGFAY